MALFSVYLPHAQNGARPDRLERARFVRDGFSWLAFFVPVIWLLVHRVWRWLLVILAFDVALMVLGSRFGLPPATLTLAGLLEMVFVGLEARHWYGLALERRGFELADVVQADTLEDAEHRFFDRFTAEQPAPTATVMTRPTSRSYGVIGLFPEQGARL